MKNLNKIIEYETEGLAEQDEIKFFQKIINDGSVWRLQGSYGRRASKLLEARLCELGEKGCHDYWGNYVPSKYEVKPGTKGSPIGGD
jgi:hypothetical protein